eukprot:6068590-Prymnesium_polylepis.1
MLADADARRQRALRRHPNARARRWLRPAGLAVVDHAHRPLRHPVNGVDALAPAEVLGGGAALLAGGD